MGQQAGRRVGELRLFLWGLSLQGYSSHFCGPSAYSVGMWDVLPLGPVGLLLTGGGDSSPRSPTQSLKWQSRRNPTQRANEERSVLSGSWLLPHTW